VFLIAGAVVTTIFADRKRRIVIDPVTVPKIIEDEGYRGLVAANVVAAKIGQIQQRTKTIASKERFELGEEPIPDIALPESGISLTSAIAFLEQSLGFSQPHIHAEIMAASGTSWHDNTTLPIVISVQLAGAKSDSSQTLVDVHTPDEAFGSAATAVLKIAEPYVLGIYENDHEHDIDAALELMRRARDQQPRNPEVYVGWGWILVSKGNYKEAIEKYKEALVFNPKYAYAHGYWANTLQRMGNYDGAIEECKLAHQDDYRYADAYGYWGNALQSKRDYDAAIDEYPA
jgi:tetratricopeptide (TPR) repeat protein